MEQLPVKGNSSIDLKGGWYKRLEEWLQFSVSRKEIKHGRGSKNIHKEKVTEHFQNIFFP